MKRLKELLLPALLAIDFILLTGVIAFGNFIEGEGPIKQFCVMFHLVPFDIAFSERGLNATAFLYCIIYYIILWMLFTLVFLGLERLFIQLFHKSR